MSRSFERIDQPADVVVGMLQETGVDFHLARENGFISGVIVSHAGISGWRCGELRSPPG